MKFYLKRTGAGLLVSFFLFLGSENLFAQSFFNPLGLGEIVPPASARLNALGSPFALSTANPGNFVHLSKTNLNISLLTGATIGRQGDNTRALATVRPAGFFGAVPLPTHTTVLLGLEHRFCQDFNIWSESSIDTLPRHHIVGRGGVYSFSAGLAQSLLSHFCLGIQLHQIWGGSRENWEFHPPEGSIATDTIEIDYSGVSARLGFSTILSPGKLCPLHLALSYDPPHTISAQRIKYIHGVSEDSLRTYSLKLPSTVAFGATADVSSSIKVSLGLEFRPWAQAKIDNKQADFGNVWRGSVGLEYQLPSNYPLRIGYSMGDWYCLSRVEEKPVTEKGVHLGFGLPIPQFGGVHFAGEVLFRRGETPSGVLRETVGRFHLTLAYEETWAKRTRRWGY